MEPLVQGRFGSAGPAPGPFVIKPVYRSEGLGWWRRVGWALSVKRPIVVGNDAVEAMEALIDAGMAVASAASTSIPHAQPFNASDWRPIVALVPPPRTHQGTAEGGKSAGVDLPAGASFRGSPELGPFPLRDVEGGAE